jgi:hypothetical protein
LCDDESTEACEWNLLVGEEATLVFTNDLERDLGFHGPAELESLDPTFYADIQNAWEQEMKPAHVSQGAYVSEAAYMEGATARLAFMAQSTTTNLIWPPRQLDADGLRLESPNQPLMTSATVESWTKLSAAGAPSEFALRAPVLGGIQTVFVRFEQGPCGVFLVADDEEYEPAIGDEVPSPINLVPSILFAQRIDRKPIASPVYGRLWEHTERSSRCCRKPRIYRRRRLPTMWW